MDLYKICSFDASGVKTGLPSGKKFEHRNKGRKLEKSSSLKLEDIEL